MIRYIAIAFLLAFGPTSHLSLLYYSASSEGVLANNDLLFFLIFLGWVLSSLGVLLVGLEYELLAENKTASY